MAYFSELIQLKLRSRLHSPQAIEDVRQETFSRVFAALRGGKIRQPDRLGAFVNSMCNNVLLEHYRASSRDQFAGGRRAEGLSGLDRGCARRHCRQANGERRFAKSWTRCPKEIGGCCAKSSWKNVTKMKCAATLASIATTSGCCCTGPNSHSSPCI